MALAAPRNGVIEIAGPERAPFNEIVARYLKAAGDRREVVRDPEARYWGGRLEEHSLVPLGDVRLGRMVWTNGRGAPSRGEHLPWEFSICWRRDEAIPGSAQSAGYESHRLRGDCNHYEAKYAIAASTPPFPCGTPFRRRLISTAVSAPSTIASFRSPIWPMRNTRPCSLLSPPPNETL